MYEKCTVVAYISKWVLLLNLHMNWLFLASLLVPCNICKHKIFFMYSHSVSTFIIKKNCIRISIFFSTTLIIWLVLEQAVEALLSGMEDFFLFNFLLVVKWINYLLFCTSFIRGKVATTKPLYISRVLRAYFPWFPSV